jgi:hypothetical protein
LEEELTHKEDHARWLSKQQILLQSHEQEPVDLTWAREMEGSVTYALTEDSPFGGQRTYELVSTDCRSATCVARVRWESAETARGAFFDLMGDTRNVPCVSQAVLPEVDDRNASLEVAVHFDCTETRFGS